MESENRYSSHPSFEWSQNETHVFITAELPKRDRETNPCVENQDKKINITQCVFSPASCSPNDSTCLCDTIKFLMNDSEVFSLQLYDSFIKNQSVVKRLELFDGFQIILKKSKTDKKMWPRLTHATSKLHYVNVDWSKWKPEEEAHEPLNKSLPSDETWNQVTLQSGEKVKVPPLNLCTTLTDCVLKIQQEDCNPILNEMVPSLKDLLVDERQGVVLEFWTKTLTRAQRLYTLTTVWNLTRIDERKELLHILVMEMAKVNDGLADSIKGGSQVLSDLDGSEYERRHVSLPTAWLLEFKTNLTDHEKIMVLGDLFKHIAVEEKTIVCSTFI